MVSSRALPFAILIALVRAATSPLGMLKMVARVELPRNSRAAPINGQILELDLITAWGLKRSLTNKLGLKQGKSSADFQPSGAALYERRSSTSMRPRTLSGPLQHQ